MSVFFKKYRKRIIIVSVIILTLMAVFFLADGPEIKKNTKTATGSTSNASGVVVGAEKHTHISVAASDNSRPENKNQTKNETTEEEIPEKSVEEISEKSIEQISEKSVEEIPEKSVEEIPEKSVEEIPEKSVEEIPEKSVEEIPENSIEEIPEESHNESAHKCTISIECPVLNEHKDDLAKNKRPLVPSDGIILSPVTLEYSEGESVFDVTKRICMENRIHFEFTMTPIYNTAYIEGIYNLYEFDCGSASGWVYSVNGEIPSYGCSDYKVSDGDVIIWHYTCALGNDIQFYAA